jgi:hypothetical protein
MKNKINIRGLVLRVLLLITLALVISPSLIANGRTVTETIGISQTYAQQTNSNGDICGGNSKSSTTEDPTKPKPPLVSLIEMIIILEKLLLGLNIPLVWVIGKLMSNDWVYLDGQMANILNSLWLIVRNFVNILFAAILIFIAFKTVVGGGSEKTNFAVRTVLPKFVIALVLVNFSLLFGKLILDAGNLATTASFSIVSSVQGDVFGSADVNAQKKWFCTNPSDDHTCLAKTYFVGFGTDGKEEICSGANPKVTSLSQGPDDPQYRNSGDSWVIAPSKERITTFDGALFNARDAMYVYSYNIFHLADIMKVFDKQYPNGVNLQDLTGITMNVVLAIVMAGFLILINIAMLIAFAVRMVMIWILLIFSPIMAVDIVFTGATKKIPILKNGFLNTFLSLSFMPAIAGFILSMGFIMYTVLNAHPEFTGNSTLGIGGVSVYIAGNLLPGFANLQQLILSLVMMVIMWSAIFFMFKSNAIIEKATNSIQHFGQGIAKAGGEGLKSIPFIPTGGKRKASLASLEMIPGKISSYNQIKAEGDAQDAFEGTVLQKYFGTRGMTPEDKKWATDLASRITPNSTLTPEDKSKLLDLISNGYKDQDHQKYLQPIFNKAGSKLNLNTATPDDVAQELINRFRFRREDVHPEDIHEYPDASKSRPATAGATTTATGPTVTVTAPTATNTNYNIEVDGSTFILKPDEASKFIKSYDEAQKLGKLAGLTQPQWSAIQSKLQAAGTKPAH